MSSQKGNTSRTRGQKYQNATAFKNNKYGASVQVKVANAKVHDGVCQHCKDILEWKVKYNKYKPLTQPRKCVKCLQKTVRDAYCIICRPCALSQGACAKCGKEKDIVIPFRPKQEGGAEVVEDKSSQASDTQKKRWAKEEDEDEDDKSSSDCDSGSDLGHTDSSEGTVDRHSKVTLPDISSIKM
ncbi:hypothetical protein GN956_G19355 [Arapaima gigas]